MNNEQYEKLTEEEKRKLPASVLMSMAYARIQREQQGKVGEENE
ncbi:hypothetical protein [Bacillus sp. FSL M7-0417]|nr:hypothetical protein [Bacillus subtilis]